MPFSIPSGLRRLGELIRGSQTVIPVLFALLVGAGAGAVSVLFHESIAVTREFFFETLGIPARAALGAAYTIPILALGGLVVGLITRFLAPEAKGHGIPEVMVAVAYRGGRIRPRVTVFKALAAAITIGSGGSAGQEGPIAQIGAALGSSLGQWFRLTDRQITLSVACGAAGGIAATFNAPIAGVMFALEVILARFTALTFGLVVVSATTATVVCRSVLGDSPAFHIPSKYDVTSFREIVLFAVLGVLCALVAQVFIRALYHVEAASERIKMPLVLKPAVGAALVGGIGIWAPQVFGNGYETIESALGGELVLRTLVLLCAAKIVATALTVGSGAAGGVFAPSLYIGATFGGAFGCVMNQWIPSGISGPGAFALVGMAAMFGGSAHAPITAVFMVFEMTDNYQIILPLMIATVLSTFVCQRISPESMYTIKLRRTGIHIGGAQDINLMDAITVREAMTEKFDAVSPDLPLTALIMKLATGHYTGYPVINREGRLEGIVTGQDVEKAIIDRNPADLRVRDICTRNVAVARPDQTLSHALAEFGARNIGRLPVIDPENPDRVIGMLNRADIVTAYADAYRRGGRGLMMRLDEMRALSETSDTVLEEATVTSGAALDGTYVREAHFPEQSTLVKVRRAEETIIPSGSTRLEPGDTLVVLTTRRHARRVRNWLRDHC